MSSRAETELVDPVDRFAALTTKKFVSLEESVGLCRLIGKRIADGEPRADIAIGLANGGILPAVVAADAAGIECQIVRVRRKSSRLKQRLGFLKRILHRFPAVLKFKPFRLLTRRLDTTFSQVEAGGDAGFSNLDVAGRHVIIVDDCVDSGSSAAHVRDAVLARGAASVRVAVISWATKYDSKAKHGVEPDIYLSRVLHHFPWAMNNPEYDRFEAWLGDNGHMLWR